MTHGIPTRELAQHHDLTAPTRNASPWAIRTRLSSLYDAGKIGDADRAACARFRLDYENAAGVSRPRLGERVDGSTGRGAIDFHLDSINALRAVKQTIGALPFELCERCIVHDENWGGIGMRVGCTDKTAVTRTVKAIQRMTDAYAFLDKRQ